MSAPSSLSAAGQTTDGKPVIAGVGSLLTTHGVPLEVTLGFMKEHGLVPDWVDFIATCRQDGHKPATIRARVLSAVGDAYGSGYLASFQPRLDAALGPA